MVIIKRAPKDMGLPPDIKWLAGSTKLRSFDACSTFVDAIRSFLWYCGVPPKIAFKRFKK